MHMLPHRSRGVTERFNEYENDVNHKYVMCNGLTVTRQPRHRKHQMTAGTWGSQ